MTLAQIEILAAEVLAATTATVIALRGLIALLSKLAEHTATKADDEAALKLSAALDKVTWALDLLRRFLPRVVVGPMPAAVPLNDESVRSLRPPPQSAARRMPSLKPTKLRPLPSAQASKTPPPPAAGADE
jgi:hypothetical protein